MNRPVNNEELDEMIERTSASRSGSPKFSWERAQHALQFRALTELRDLRTK